MIFSSQDFLRLFIAYGVIWGIFTLGSSEIREIWHFYILLNLAIFFVAYLTTIPCSKTAPQLLGVLYLGLPFLLRLHGSAAHGELIDMVSFSLGVSVLASIPYFSYLNDFDVLPRRVWRGLAVFWLGVSVSAALFIWFVGMWLPLVPSVVLAAFLHVGAVCGRVPAPLAYATPHASLAFSAAASPLGEITAAIAATAPYLAALSQLKNSENKTEAPTTPRGG
jgi:hypothetical protein